MLTILNQQPAEKCEHTQGDYIDIHTVFRTIQGEGPFMGQPATFVRLAGCNLQCPLCDTNYTDGRGTLDLQDAMKLVNTFFVPKKLVVITGGEPFRQSIGPFVRMLLDAEYRVQIETNGTVYDESMEINWFHPYLSVVCSPKCRIAPKLKPHISALKYILSADSVAPANGLPIHVLGSGNGVPEAPWASFIGKVYVQPCYVQGDLEATNRNVQACIESVMRYGYTLSLQLHKVLDLP